MGYYRRYPTGVTPSVPTTTVFTDALVVIAITQGTQGTGVPSADTTEVGGYRPTLGGVPGLGDTETWTVVQRRERVTMTSLPPTSSTPVRNPRSPRVKLLDRSLCRQDDSCDPRTWNPPTRRFPTDPGTGVPDRRGVNPLAVRTVRVTGPCEALHGIRGG